MGARTIKEVADAAGVSTTAVSLFLNNRPGISQATRERIAAAVATVGYTPRGAGRRNGAQGFVGLLVEQLPLPLHTDHFYSEVLRGIQEEADRLGYSVALSVVDAQQPALPRIVTEQQVAGLLAIGGGDITDALLDRVVAGDMPLVAIDNQSEARHIDSVVVDNQRGGALATRHLLELGHRRIAIILGPTKYKSLGERAMGYLQALWEAGIPADERLIQPALSHGLPRKGYVEMQRLLQLDPLPTAVFAVSDRTALGALDAIYERGLRVPEDISLVGFDDIALGAHARPPLATVRTDKYAMGATAVRRLDDLLGERSHTPLRQVLPVDLVVRDSTAPPRA
jgi:LacI family transcriptional regulator